VILIHCILKEIETIEHMKRLLARSSYSQSFDMAFYSHQLSQRNIRSNQTLSLRNLHITTRQA